MSGKFVNARNAVRYYQVQFTKFIERFIEVEVTTGYTRGGHL